ncbi:MAG: tyrosine-type recombinase/integrase [Armatimonadota bacterium]
MTAEISHYTSSLAPHLCAYVAERLACGFKCNTMQAHLRAFDRWLATNPCPPDTLPRATVEAWIAKRPNEQPNTHCSRICSPRQFARHLTRQGLPAYLPPPGSGHADRFGFVPRIFTPAEVQRIFQEVDQWPYLPHRPVRYLVMPEVYRVLYGCGLRVGEALSLRIRDVDLAQGVLTIRKAKFDKERLIPVAPTLLARLQRYATARGQRPLDEPFFSDEHGVQITHAAVYTMFREILWRMRIPFVGGGHGPRIHDLRHTFAVHRLIHWYHQGVDLHAMLPLLSTYLGHVGMAGTQRYLTLVQDLLPAITERLEQLVGHVIPGGDAV